MANDFYTPSGTPANRSTGSSAAMRSELALIQAAFDKLPALSGNAGKFAKVNAGATAVDVSSILSEDGSTLAIAGALNVDSNTLYVDATNNNVGIGRTPASNVKVDILGVNNSTGYAGNSDLRISSANQTISTVYSWNQIAVAGGDFLIGMNGAERMRINSSVGKVLFGTTSIDPSGQRTNGLAIDNVGGINQRSPSGNTVFALPSTSGNHVVFKTDNGSAAVTAGVISSSGSTTSYNTSSDARLKDNIADAHDAGHVIDTIRIRQFDWKDDGTHQRYGVVAQELVTVYPEAVTEGDVWAVDHSKLVPLLVKEVQGLRVRVAALETKP